jgi:hypothetical protein
MHRIGQLCASNKVATEAKIKQMIIYLITQLIAPRVTSVIQAVSRLAQTLDNASFRMSTASALRSPTALKVQHVQIAGAHEKNARQCNSRRRVARRIG